MLLLANQDICDEISSFATNPKRNEFINKLDDLIKNPLIIQENMPTKFMKYILNGNYWTYQASLHQNHNG